MGSFGFCREELGLILRRVCVGFVEIWVGLWSVERHMEPPKGILASLWNFIRFLPFFIGLLLLGTIKGGHCQFWFLVSRLFCFSLVPVILLFLAVLLFFTQFGCAGKHLISFPVF